MDLFPTLLIIFLLSSAMIEESNAAVSSQLYWHTILPNTPMPKAIRDLILSDVEIEKTGPPLDFIIGGIPDLLFQPSNYLTASYHSEAVYMGEVTKSPIATLFFLEKDLHPNAKMTVQFPSTSFKAAFLPRRIAESIPFSSKNLPEILRYFSINSTSLQSKTVAKNLQMCEAPPAPKERKLCATSVESMVDFATSNLGTLDVRILSTNVGKEGRPKQVYTIGSSGVHKMARLDIVGCHILIHPHGLFYCHSTGEALAYTIEMVGEDGALVEAAAVCHLDTSDWNPNYLGLQLLKVSPGTPVCHFLPPDHLVWAHHN